MLPPLSHIVDFDITNYTILTAADCSSTEQHRPLSPGHSTFFRVLVVGLNSHGARNQYYLLTFSSGDSGWTAPRECPNDDDISHVYKRGGAVVCRGTAHWLFTGYTLDVSADTGRVSFTELIFQPRRFSWSSSGARLLSIANDGTLSLINLRRDDNQIHIWTRQDTQSRHHGITEWLCTRIIELKRPHNSMYYRFSVCVGERSNTLLFLDPSVHVANLETGATEDVSEQFEGLLYEPAQPLMVDWPSFFMSRLGYSGERCTPSVQKYKMF
jgi:hypothetical protein